MIDDPSIDASNYKLQRQNYVLFYFTIPTQKLADVKHIFIYKLNIYIVQQQIKGK